MTTKHTTKTKSARRKPVFIPDPPRLKPGEMTCFDHIAANGNLHHLYQHFGNPETTIVRGPRYLLAEPEAPHSERRVPDLLISFDADSDLYKANNAYIISEQSKPPDFVMEIASRGTWRRDRWAKREDYLVMGVRECWRFDETGQYYGERLAGDILVEGEYRPIAIETLEEGVLQGYSPALDLHIRWEHGQLRWHVPATGQHIATFESEREGRLRAEQARLQAEHESRLQAEQAHVQSEQGCLQVEARVRELEERLRQRNP